MPTELILTYAQIKHEAKKSQLSFFSPRQIARDIYNDALHDPNFLKRNLRYISMPCFLLLIKLNVKIDTAFLIAIFIYPLLLILCYGPGIAKYYLANRSHQPTDKALTQNSLKETITIAEKEVTKKLVTIPINSIFYKKDDGASTDCSTVTSLAKLKLQ